MDLLRLRWLSSGYILNSRPPLGTALRKPCAHQGRAARIDQDMPKINKHYRLDLQKILVELNRGHMVGGWEDVARSCFRYS
jgi:hypothetical protein